jgi:hypothetical protein
MSIFGKLSISLASIRVNVVFLNSTRYFSKWQVFVVDIFNFISAAICTAFSLSDSSFLIKTVNNRCGNLIIGHNVR